MSARGPNLSHWPGNRTPREWKADLSTGICLNFAKAPASDQEEFLMGATAVLNDHYDTDGFLSLLSVLAPDIALPRQSTLLRAAATGDYQSFHGPEAFAVDRIVLNLAHPDSPVATEFVGLQGPAKDFARYRWLLAHAAQVLDAPWNWRVLYESELAAVQRELQSTARDCQLQQDLGLALLRSAGVMRRLVVNTVAQDCFRVLHTWSTDQGLFCRHHDRTETWFEVQTFQPPPRLDLEPLKRELAELEPPGSLGEWCLDSAEEPVPELYHGMPGPQEYGQVTRRLTASNIPQDRLEEAFIRFFAQARVQT
jgi:hypothetical protein